MQLRDYCEVLTLTTFLYNFTPLLYHLPLKMSSQQPFSPLPLVGEVHHIHHLSENIGRLYISDEYSDITLVIGENRIPAHKVILAARSEYFRALLYGGMKESSQEEIKLVDTPLVAFKHLLRYIYTGNMSLNSFKEDLILDILGLAHLYGFLDLETSVSDYLKAVLSVRTVCLIYDTASLYQLTDLANAALMFMDRHAMEVLIHESFLTLSESAVQSIISRDSFCAAEVDIFRAVASWSAANPGTDIQPILGEIRLSLLDIPDLLKVVRPTFLMPADILLDAIQSRTEMRDTELRYRGYKIAEENIALPRHGASVLVGEVKSALLDGDTKNYDMERGFSRHPIDESGDRGIVVKLGMPCIINRINMLLWDRDQRAYSYFIEVSMDQSDWVRVVDHSTYHCRSWQFLHFPQRVVRYIRVVGTHNTVNKVFHVVTLEALWSEQVLPLHQGLVVPQENIATLSHSALVIEGVCRSRNALLNGDTAHYDWDSGYTCHQLGSGAIMVQLGQPYSLDSMRLLLWDCDDRSYSYYIEVSVNQRDWEVVCDRTREAARSWQLITFKRRPVVFVRIVGTHNTANEVFHCVHFEAPAAQADKTGSLSPCRGLRGESGSGESSQDEMESPDAEFMDHNVDQNIMQGLDVRQDGAVGGHEVECPEPVAEHRNALQGIPEHQHNDPFQLPLAAAALPLGPPVLPMGAAANLQGIGRSQAGIQGIGGEVVRVPQVMGAVPRSVRTVRRGPNPPPSP